MSLEATRRPIRRALLSVYDKTGLIELATALRAAGVELVSTGSTAAQIAAAGLEVTPVESLTGFPECLDGRVKTLHPRIHAGILADTRLPAHLRQLEDLEVAPFELVVVNLYPFTQTVASGADFDACVEQIDIGGPSMVRAAAKNHPSVAVVVNPGNYSQVLSAVKQGGFTLPERRQLAAQAFAHTGAYDVAVGSWFAEQLAGEQIAGEQLPGEQFAAEQHAGEQPAGKQQGELGAPQWFGASWELSQSLRYGENPHQSAALYVNQSGAPGLARAEQLHGKAMSYNNYVDADAAWRAAHDHPAPAVAIIKHANPCGIAVGSDIAQAHARAHQTDPLSAFGGVIAANRSITLAAAQQISEVFTEVVVAPDYDPAALELLTQKKNIRVLKLAATQQSSQELRPISGGLLVQQVDRIDAKIAGGGDNFADWRLVSGAPADEQTAADLQFAWRAVRAVKSNAILLANNGAAVGIGMGQVNRVDSCKLAVQRANADQQNRAQGAVAASDAFFPFADGFQVLADAGVRAVVQPGGSVRDDEVIAAADAAGVTLYLTGTRHFAH